MHLKDNIQHLTFFGHLPYLLANHLWPRPPEERQERFLQASWDSFFQASRDNFFQPSWDKLLDAAATSSGVDTRSIWTGRSSLRSVTPCWGSSTCLIISQDISGQFNEGKLKQGIDLSNLKVEISVECS